MNEAFILGFGFVGKATAKALNIPFHYSTNDSNITLEEGAKKQFCFICLPTATDHLNNQTASLKVIKEYISHIRSLDSRCIFVIRSTVLPGTCQSLSKEFGVPVCSNPEFLSEDTWEEDAVHPRLLVLGADEEHIKQALLMAWKDVKTHNLLVTNTVTAETFKYAFNTFMITKIIWANQIYDVCLQNGADYKKIRETLMNHPWGSKHHFKVIHKGGRGAGGHCFPKDLKAFKKYSGSEFFKLIDTLNEKLLKESKKK